MTDEYTPYLLLEAWTIPGTSVPADVGEQPAVALVTQAQLQALRDLRAQRSAERSLRGELLALLAVGAAVEPGSLRARIDLSQRRMLNAKTLAMLLGPDRVAELLAAVEPTPFRTLVVEPKGGGK